MIRVLKDHQVKSIIDAYNKQQENESFKKGERENFLMGFIGTNRTGKTTGMRKIVDKWRSNNSGSIISFDPQHRFEDVSDFLLQPFEMDESVDKILNLRNGLLIIDDIREFHPKNIADTWLLRLMSARCQWNVDIVYAIHNPKLLLNTMAYYTTHYFIYMTQTLQGGWDKKVSNYVVCQAASTEVNRYVSLNGKGTYPNFPHIIVDNLTGECTAQNMKYN